ncbi:MAG: UDP-N-acetylmuramoyl-L-alanyl-D-glutamate--2,6-diaminopimelate ligase [Candidatus Hydrogenedentes bacterium]|nr:UDP-N-acetylmuramoyl-L-alanyl-D-glutamate--2,6-diaminopimelate ligase [Candidatus Hydrogenedentota bacterium]
MNLSDLPKWLGSDAAGLPDTPVETVTEDSRRVRPGTVFVAAPGTRTDGHAYAQQAAGAGAVAIVGARRGVTSLYGVPYLFSEYPRRSLGLVAHALAGDPSRAMTVIGVTGTNGKSSSILLTQRVLEHCGHPTAAFGTLGYDIAGTTLPAAHTTPFGEELAEMFRRARDAGLTHVVMEVSSHALDQERVAGIDFDVAAFTNLTQDHLDYHPGMDAYRRAKLLLFERIQGPGSFTVVNRGDPSAPYFIAASRVPCYTYGAEGYVRPRDVRMGLDGTSFTIETPWGTQRIRTALLGLHNVANLLGVIAIGGGLGLPLESIAQGVESLEHIPGRFERVDAGQDFLVIVDYAHTEDGLHNVLNAARTVCENRVICVFGCGGDRDKTKRPKMAAVAARQADFAIITSDNPRTEDPLRIIDEVEAGMIASGKRSGAEYEIIPDRAEAIRRALGFAKPGDLVLIAGKGHEDYQILGTEKIHFDDREVARAILEGRPATCLGRTRFVSSPT